MYRKDKMGSKTFKEAYSQEKVLAELAIKLAMVRKERSLTQEDLSDLAGVTQQQISKIECGENCETVTLIKVCQALDLHLEAV